MPDHRPQPARRWAPDDRGAVAVIVALLMGIFLVLLAFVVDFGRVYTTQAQLQNTADAAALAAARDLPVSSGCAGQPPSSGTSACKVAGDYVSGNGYSLASSTVTSAAGSNQVAVQVTTNVPFVFGQLVGVPGRTISARAAATKTTTGGAAGYTIFTEGNLDVTGNFTVTGSVYAGGSATVWGSASISGDLVAGAHGPGRNVTGANRVAGSVWAWGAIDQTAANRYAGWRTAPVEVITVQDYALNHVNLQARLDADDALSAPQHRVVTSGACEPVVTTVFLECTGAGMTVDLKDIRHSSFPNLRTVKVERFTGTGNTVVGTWTDPPGPILLWATSSSATAFNLQGNGEVNGYLYAPNGGYSSTGGRNINGRIMTKVSASGAGNPNPSSANAFENANFGSTGVRLSE